MVNDEKKNQQHHSMHPSIDHGLLSPSGKMSKRAREAAMKRESNRLFPIGYFDKPEPTLEQKRKATIDNCRQRAKELHGLADRGMCVRKYRREARKLEDLAEKLEKEEIK